MNSNFHDPQFSINSEHILDILRAKKLNRFFTQFHPFFTTRSTSKSCNDPPKVLTEGSMVEYLPVGSQEAPQTIIGKKKFQPQTPKLHSQPSVDWRVVAHFPENPKIGKGTHFDQSNLQEGWIPKKIWQA